MLSFYYTAKWNSYTHTHICPLLGLLPIQITTEHGAVLCAVHGSPQLPISYRAVYTCWSQSPKASHPRPPSPRELKQSYAQGKDKMVFVRDGGVGKKENYCSIDICISVLQDGKSQKCVAQQCVHSVLRLMCWTLKNGLDGQFYVVTKGSIP